MDSTENIENANWSETISEEVYATTKGPQIQYVGTRVGFYLWVYASPFIFLFGIGGNVLIVMVMRRKLFQGTSPGVYLPLLAVSDTVVLILGLLADWLEWTGIVNFKELHIWTCKFYKFSFFTAGDVAIWFIVAFTFDRFVAVCFPFHKRSVCTARRAVAASVCLLVLAVAKNFHEFWTRGHEFYRGDELIRCGVSDEYRYFHWYVRPWIAFTVIMAAPFCIILLCNCLIVRTLVHAQRRRVSQTQASSNTSAAFIQTTLMCLSVSFCFLVCIAPSIVLLIGKPYWTIAKRNPAYDIAKHFSNQLVYVNHSINFFLYCLTGERFRRELTDLFKRNTTFDSISSNMQTLGT